LRDDLSQPRKADSEMKCKASIGIRLYFCDAALNGEFHRVIIVATALGMGVAKQHFNLCGACLLIAARNT
jgi:hypothetical protein